MKLRGMMFLIILLILPIASSTNEYSGFESLIRNRIESAFIQSDLTMHNPIVITDSSDFTALGFAGNGSAISPFLIESLQISSAGEPCISLTGIADVYFTIKSCSLSGSRGTGIADASLHFDSGIGTIEHCEFYNSTIGIGFTNVSSSVSDCSFSEVYETSMWGVNVTDSLVSQNSFISNGTYSVLLSSTNHTTIASNIFNSTYEMNVTHQVGLFDCLDMDLVHNYISSHSTDEAVVCDSINDLFCFNNTFVLSSGIGAMVTGDSVRIEECNFTYIGPNFLPHYPRSLMLGRTGYADNISTDYKVINCTFQDLGIVLSRVRGLNVSLCQFIDTKGIQNVHLLIEKSEFSSTLIYKNMFFNCSTAIRVDRTVTDIMITGNSLIECDDGIETEANRSAIINNMLIGSDKDYRAAIWTSPDFGRNITIALNHIEGFYYGLNIQGHDDFIYNNNITNNRIGVQLASVSSNNSVYYNRFYDNIQHADDDGESNVWDDGVSQGNWWDDYGGEGTYTIPGSAHAVDRYPSGPPPPTTSTPPVTTSPISSTTTQTETTTPTDTGGFQGWMMIFAGAAVVIILVVVAIIKKR